MGMTMYALIDKTTRQCYAYVLSQEGYDPALYDFVETPVDFENWVWDVATETFVARPPTMNEQVGSALTADPRWAALKAATPAQIETWLTNNVTDLQSARTVLKVLILAVRRLAINPQSGL